MILPAPVLTAVDVTRARRERAGNLAAAPDGPATVPVR